MTTPVGKPPCGSCKLCCQRFSAVEIKPHLGDKADDYETVMAGGARVLAFKENGDCWYLGEDGCTIHDRAPAVCREFDCRVVFLYMTRPERKQMIREGNMSREVYARGRELGDTLDEADRRDAIAMRNNNIGQMILGASHNLDQTMGKDRRGIVANVRVTRDE